MTAELRHLRAFVAIADEGNLTRAAARLHLTQPALSRTLQQLEAHLGVRLVQRSTHHLELTAAGQVFRDRAHAALAAVDEALDPHEGGDMAAASRTRLVRARPAHHDPAAAVASDAPAHPAGTAAHRRPHRRSRRGQSRRRRDPRAVSTARPAHRASCSPNHEWPSVPTDSPLAGHAVLTLADLAEYPVALNTISGTTTIGLWPENARPRTTIEVANTDDWLAAIAAGRAVGVTTSATAEMHPHPAVHYRPLTRRTAGRGVPRLAATPPSHPAVVELRDAVKAVVTSDGASTMLRTRLP